MTHAEQRTLDQIRAAQPCVVCRSVLELIKSGDSLRDAERVDLKTQQQADRYRAANNVWDAVRECAHTCHPTAPAPRQREAS